MQADVSIPLEIIIPRLQACNYPAFNEQIVNRITDDLVAAISPRWLKVEGRFSPRGGIQLTATAEHNPENRPL